MKYSPELSWYAVRTRSKAEQLVSKGLKAKQFELLMPTYQAVSPRKDRRKILTKPIFKGYLFVRLQLNPKKHLKILKTLGVIQILKNSKGPLTIPDDQIENMKLLEHHVGECFHSPEFAFGEKVVVKEGPLKGLKGTVGRVNRQMLKISIDGVPGSIMIEIDPRQLISEESGLYFKVAST